MTVGTKVICNGHEGTITKMHDGQLEGMADVRLERGAVCVPLYELKPVTDIVVNNGIGFAALTAKTQAGRSFLTKNYMVSEDGGACVENFTLQRLAELQKIAAESGLIVVDERTKTEAEYVFSEMIKFGGRP